MQSQQPDFGTLVQPSAGGASAQQSATTGAGQGSVGTTTTTAGGAGSSGSENAGAKAGGLFGAIHGAGETIRGTVNSAVDGLGDAVAGREPGSVQSHSAQGQGDSVAQKGMQEVREGYEKMTGKP